MTLDQPTERSIDLPALVALGTAELMALAHAEGVAPLPNLEHGELVRAIADHRLAAGGSGRVDGVLEVLPDGFGFVRSPRLDCRPQPHDAFVTQAQIRLLNLKTGHRLAGPLRAPRAGERFFSIGHVDLVNGGDEQVLARRVPFAAQVPLLPTAALRLHAGGDQELRAISLLAPWARGHRVLVTLPPGRDGAQLVTRLTAAMRTEDPALRCVVALLDQRPEALAAARHTLGGEAGTTVLGTTFDEPSARHPATAEMALAIAQREVEAGQHVVLLVDDLVRLARASNLALPPSGRLLCAGLDATSVHGGKRLFAAARACEAGGSLTVVATANAGDSAADRAVLEQFRLRGNSEVAFAAGSLPGEAQLDVGGTFTRRDDLLLPRPLLAAWARLRNELLAQPEGQRLDALFARLAAHPDDTTLLQQLAQTQTDR